jgi:hypothetical protein
MKKVSKTSNLNISRNMKEWSSVGIKGYLMLMLEFLRISPSYELARKSRMEGLTKEEKKLLPKDFELVLKTYDDFGDVSSIRFDEWWLTKGLYIYGTEFAKPRTRLIANVVKDEEIDQKFHRALDHHFEKIRPEEGKGPALILSVPLGINKRTVLAQISKLIDQSKVVIPVKAKKSARPLDAKRLRKDPLLIAINILWNKSKDPEIDLWRLGVLAKVSPKHMDGLDAKAQKLTSKTTDQRMKMGILTSRALKKAKQICEQAARGKFPNSSPIDLPEFNWDEIYKKIVKARLTKK